jgi:hypothetical protein
VALSSQYPPGDIDKGNSSFGLTNPNAPSSKGKKCMHRSHLSPNFRLNRDGMKRCSLFIELSIICSLAHITCPDIMFNISPEKLPIKTLGYFLLGFIPSMMTTC